MNVLETLNAINAGWTKGKTIYTNTVNFDIIDVAIATGTWFIICDYGTYEGFKTLEDAVNAYSELMHK
jgi:hypothetical protein